MKAREFFVIGKAELKMDRFRKFRKQERLKKADECWPAALWKEYLSQNQDLVPYIENGYYRRGLSGLQYALVDKFDEQVEKMVNYLDAMGLYWDLLYKNDKFTIIRYGELAFGVPNELVECHTYQNYDNESLTSLHQKIGIEMTGMNAIVPVGYVSRNDIRNDMASVQSQIEEKMQEINDLEAQKRAEIEEMKRQISEKYQEQFEMLNQKKQEMKQMMERLEKKLFVLDTELYSIRCFMGEVVRFVQLRTGSHASVEVPVVLYQKIRYLDEEMGKFLAVYGFDTEDKSIFEQAIQYRDDLFNLFAPPYKSISLVQISRNSIQYGSHPAVANMLAEYKTLHGNQIGILIRDGENLWIGWTEAERIRVSENAFLKPESKVTSLTDAGTVSTKEEIASRYFIFSILQGVLHDNRMLRLPVAISIFKANPYIAFSMADGWLEDNRFGTFDDIVNRTNQSLQVGDMVLTTLRITRDDLYSGRYGGRSTYEDKWDNNRGRGERNRTHDAAIPDRSIVPVNLVDKEVCYSILYDQYRCAFEKVPDGTEGLSNYKTTRTDEKLREGQDPFEVWNGFYDNVKREEYDLRGLSVDNIYLWYLNRDRKYWKEYNEVHMDPLNETASYKVPKGIRKGETILHYYVSAEKRESGWNGKQSYANMEIKTGEYLNLTYLNSVYVLYAIQNRKIGGWKIGDKRMDYANSIQYLNIALEYLKKREKKEAELLSQYMDLYPEWQVDLSEWRLKHSYHRLTDARAKKFAKEMRQ